MTGHSNGNSLAINASKCTHMAYGNAKIKSKYKMKEGDGTETVIRHDDKVEKDLGVLFDTKLSFRQHIGYTVKKVNRMIGLRDNKAHFSLYGPRSISSFVYFINETTRGLRGLHLESASEGSILLSWKMHREDRHDWYQTLGTGATRTD